MSVCAADMRWALLLWNLKNCMLSEGQKIQRLFMCCQVVWKPFSHGITCAPSRLVSVYFSVYVSLLLCALLWWHWSSGRWPFSSTPDLLCCANKCVFGFFFDGWSISLWYLSLIAYGVKVCDIYFIFVHKAVFPWELLSIVVFLGHFCDDIGVVCFWREFFNGWSIWIWHFSLIFDLLWSESSWHLFHFCTQSCFLMPAPNNCCKTSMVL